MERKIRCLNIIVVTVILSSILFSTNSFASVFEFFDSQVKNSYLEKAENEAEEGSSYTDEYSISGQSSTDDDKIEASSEQTMYVGYSKVCINPDPANGAIPLAGYGTSQYRTAKFAEGEQDFQQDLYATAVSVKDANGNIVIFVTCDLVGLDVSNVKKVRNAVNAAKGVEPDNIMISCTHTHSAPDTSFSNSSYPELTNSIKLYKTLLIEKITTACIEAIEDMDTAEMYVGTTDIVNEDGSSALNFVRHYNTDGKYKDGSTVVRGDNHGIYAWDGTKWVSLTRTSHVSESDTTMQIIRFDCKNKKDIVMINWQVHPTLTGGSDKTTISADWVAGFREKLQEECNCRVAYYTGAAGNLNPITFITDGSEGIAGISYNYVTDSKKTTAENNYDRSILFGETLAQYAIDKYNSLTKVSSGEIKITSKQLELTKSFNEGTQILKNAKYIQKIWNANWNDLSAMITGTYNWGANYDFPEGFDSTGAKLREYVTTYNNLLSKKIIVSGNDDEGYTCTYASGITRTIVNYLITLIGADFDNVIYSPYHANRIISNSTYEAGSTQSIEINAISIGDVSFVTIPDELFCDTGEYMKENSKSKMTFILCYTNGKTGYIPSEEGFEYGCYEADITAFAKGSAETIANELVTMIAEQNKIEGIEITGDINFDGKVNIVDLILLKRHLIAGDNEEWYLTDQKLKQADVNKDGKVNISDLISLKRLLQ